MYMRRQEKLLEKGREKPTEHEKKKDEHIIVKTISTAVDPHSSDYSLVAIQIPQLIISLPCHKYYGKLSQSVSWECTPLLEALARGRRSMNIALVLQAPKHVVYTSCSLNQRCETARLQKCAVPECIMTQNAFNGGRR